jgi:16S rRNA (guanine527-N7)-methyltransferase
MADPDWRKAQAALADIASVSRETAERLAIHVDLLRRWQPATNLVSAATLGDVWRRHVADSAQLAVLAPDARSWLDLGSGAGFPGLVTAILCTETAASHVHLVESDRRKCAFLRTVIRETGAPATVHESRFEEVIAAWQDPLDAISSRATADLAVLCAAVEPLIGAGARGYFHKGANFAEERAVAAESWQLYLIEHPSRIGPGVIVELKGLVRRQGGAQ